MNPDRDRILEDALKHELRATPTGPDPALRSFSEGGCVDAETFAAWEDDGLDGVALQAFESHLSTCSRCQAMAAAFVRSSPDAVAPSISAPEHPRTASTWAFWKWMAPIAAGAAAVTLWMVVPAQREIAEAPPQPAPAVAAPALEVQAPTPSRPAEAPAPPSEPLRDAGRVDSSAKAAAADRQRTQQQDAAAPKAVEARKEQAPASLAETVAVGAVAAAPPPPAVATPAPIPMAPPAPPSPAAPVRPPERAAANAASADLQRRAQFAFVPIEIISPAPAQRWRASAAGVERSVDAGANWTLVRPAGSETITAGTSPASGICWLIGRNGIVLVTTDGATFARVDIPDGGDLASITATSGRSATVINAAGRAFLTDDGGRTWR